MIWFFGLSGAGKTTLAKKDRSKNIRRIAMVIYENLLINPKVELNKVIENLEINKLFTANIDSINFKLPSSTVYRNDFLDTDISKQSNKYIDCLDSYAKLRIQQVFDHFSFKLYNVYSHIQLNMIHKLAQFLLINFEAFKSNEVDGKVPLLFFFFSYAKKYDKEHYNQFAFEILKGVLMEELSTIENRRIEENSKIAGIGWSLIKFIENDYFESDDIEDILSIIDKAVFSEVERLSRTGFEISYIIQLISLGLYLKERINLTKSNELKVLEVKEYLLITFFELTTNIHLLPRERITLFGLCRIFFDEGINHKMVSHFCIDGLKKLDKMITETYKKETFESALAYNLFFPDVVKNYKTDSLIKIEDYANRLIKDLYLESEKDTNNNLKKLLVSGIYLINKDKEIEQESAHLYLLGFLLNSIDNE